jgi:hypothetical protein
MKMKSEMTQTDPVSASPRLRDKRSFSKLNGRWLLKKDANRDVSVNDSVLLKCDPPSACLERLRQAQAQHYAAAPCDALIAS